MTDASWLTGLVRDIPDFPEPGITFRDITPLLGDVDAFRFVVDALADEFAGETIDRVLGIEARGFLLAAPVAYRLGAALVPVRKSGKLPHDTHTESYQLEYGSDALELHVDALGAGDTCLVIDDVLATGGTAAAVGRLIERLGGRLAGYGFLIELDALGGRSQLGEGHVRTLLTY
ncbi:MAG TPA: adenine phosphoribosyltransferase [Acidimicrobiales bacterium]|jgi:adenine phosphoribosyltransferase